MSKRARRDVDLLEDLLRTALQRGNAKIILAVVEMFSAEGLVMDKKLVEAMAISHPSIC